MYSVRSAVSCVVLTAFSHFIDQKFQVKKIVANENIVNYSEMLETIVANTVAAN